MDTTQHMDQNFSQACQPEFFKIWGVWTFFSFFQKNREILAEAGTF